MSDAEQQSPRLADYQLADRYTAVAGRVFLTGSQALVRLPIMQRQRDLANGLNTAGFISGYTGSPLGGYDTALGQARPVLAANQIHFQPGVNEDLAATAVWGSQQTHLIAGPKFDGVFALWYGKGPGLDRSGDALKHGSYAGTSEHGGVLVLAGDDHGAKSSTTAHQSDHAFIHFGMPYLNPANVQDYLDLGLHGLAMSRFSGCWIGFKCVTDTVESSASVDIDPHRVRIVLPGGDSERSAAGLNLRWGVPALEAEARQYQLRLPAVNAYVRANRLDREIISSNRGVLGIVTSGKAYLDVMQALDELGLDAPACERLGLSVYKVAMPWPLEPIGAAAFAARHREILVIEEKRPIIEDQLARLLVNDPARPVLVGKRDASGQPLIASEGELAPGKVAVAIATRLLALTHDDDLRVRLESLQGRSAALTGAAARLKRMPSFCAGCPHNTSTRVPEGSIAFGGIGCHGMATFLPERRTPTLFQMGGEGAPWIGISRFSATPHIFQNLGDGTYFHSGLLAIRAAVAARVNITYKILVNDAIAMTGGQKIEGQVRVDDLVRQVQAEGVRRVAVVSDDIRKYRRGGRFPAGVELHHRDNLDAVQKQMRDIEGVTVIVYEQYCATELRRRRKRGITVDPDQRTFINERVCEGCGDCGVQSNCIAIEPVETPFGRKRAINQSACNKDFSCLKGYCPSFVSVYGARPKKRGRTSDVGFDVRLRAAALPAPPARSLATQPCNILVTGIGGAGVVTLGAMIGMAAHLEKKGCSVLDMSGLAQRNGPVTSHIRIAAAPEQIHATRIAAADLIIGSDIVVTSSPEVIAKIVAGRTRAVVNSHIAPTADFATRPDLDLSASEMEQALAGLAPEAHFIAATELASRLMGNELAANLLLVGYAMQRGWMPVSLAAMEAAIELNGTGVDMNKESLAWGRLAAENLRAVEQCAGLIAPERAQAVPGIDEIVARNYADLADYQNAAYAARYRKRMDRVRQRERQVMGEEGALSRAVAHGLHKLMAYKDEYEVARLYSRQEFREQLRNTFEGDFRIELNMAPPFLQRRDARTGRYRKRSFGPWILPVLNQLRKLKRLRGTPFDVFGYARHRRVERELIVEYETLLDELLAGLSVRQHELAVQIATLAEQIRGYDVVKEANLERVRGQWAALLARFRNSTEPVSREQASRAATQEAAC